MATDARTREVLRRLELDVTHRLDGLLQGNYRGLVSGLGSEPGDTRAYVPGDDVRRMDWNVTARVGEPHVRDSVADRELETSILVDISPSLDFGTALRTKAELALAAVAAIGLLTERAGNRLGAVVSDGSTVEEFKTGTGRRHLMALLLRLHTLTSSEEPKPTSHDRAQTLADAMLRLTGQRHRGGLAVVISDLLADDWHKPLKAVARKHETLVLEIVDPRELELPNVGVIELVDRETGAVREVDTRNRKLRDRYEEAGRARLAEHAGAIRSARADHLVLRTDRDWVIDLARFVDRRRRGRRVA